MQRRDSSGARAKSVAEPQLVGGRTFSYGRRAEKEEKRRTEWKKSSTEGLEKCPRTLGGSKMDPRRSQNRPPEWPKWPPGGLRLLGARSAPGGRPGRSETASGRLLGRSWRLLAPSWAALGASWGRLGAPGAVLGGSPLTSCREAVTGRYDWTQTPRDDPDDETDETNRTKRPDRRDF